ncbi:hypothetical protein P692DRAFT_20883084 [Suillus brevipes Sb2]|nr:hypothetical protein P692DRAFT_20883084 [Suillus brevipes Sb2]
MSDRCIQSPHHFSIRPQVHPHLKDPRFWLTSSLQPYVAVIGAQGNCALTFAILPT